MKILFFSDPHIHNFREFSEINEGTNSRLQEQLLCIDRIISCADEKELDVVVFLGDLFHLKNQLDSRVIKLVVDKIQKLSQMTRLGLWIVPGNHDYVKWDRDAAILEVLEEVGPDRIELFSKITTAHIIDDWRFFIAPYYRKPEGIELMLKKFDADNKTIFLGHQDLIGTYYGGIRADQGLDPDMLSAKFKWSFVGHFHESKLIRPNVISVGSPLQLSFGEMGQDKGWWFLDTECGEPQLIKNTESPEFLELVLEPEEEVDFTDDKNYYRIRSKGAVAPKGIERIKWHRLSFEALRDKFSKERSEIKFSDSAELLIEKYIKARNVNGLDEEKLKAVGRKYLQ